MNSSFKKTKSALSIWHFVILLTISYAIGLFISHRTTPSEQIYWSGYKLEQKNENGSWISSDRMKIGRKQSIQEIRFSINIDSSSKWQQPISLLVGGPFSAEIFWDGQNIGNKGDVGTNGDTEIAGPIDFSVFVPPSLLTQGEHQLMLRLSTSHLLFDDKSVLHFVWLTPYQQDWQRNIGYYAVPLVILGCLLLLSLQSVRIGFNAVNTMHSGLGLFGFFVAINLVSEVSRAIVNYPYFYHELRGLVAWFSSIGACLALHYVCYRLVPTKFTKIVLCITFALVLIMYFIPMNSGDRRLAYEFLILTFGPAVVFIRQYLNRDISYFCTLPIFWFACFISQFISIGLFLDSFIYLSSLLLIGGAWLWTYVSVPIRRSKQKNGDETKSFSVKSAGIERVISIDDCYGLKGEGNFTSIMLNSGECILHQDGLGALMQTKPQNFMRVHKSFAVNLSKVITLKSASGSKYWLVMENNETVPVSRYRVAEIRERIRTKQNSH